MSQMVSGISLISLGNYLSNNMHIYLNAYDIIYYQIFYIK